MPGRPAVRPVLVLLHRWIGLATAGFLFLAGLTGSVIAFDSELDAWLNPDLFRTASRGPALSPDRLAAAVEASRPGLRVVSVPVNLTPGEAARLAVRPALDPATGRPLALAFDQLFADPVTGELLGVRDSDACCSLRTAIPFLYRFHYMLQLPGEWGEVGRWLMGIVAVLWLGDCFVGAALTLPRRRPVLARWRVAWAVKLPSSAHRVVHDLHRASGLWFWAVLLLLAVSAIYFNLYRELFRPAVELISPLTPTVYETRAPLPPARQVPTLGFDRALALAEAEAARRGWPERPDRVLYTSRDLYGVTFHPSQDRRGAGLGTPVLHLDAQDGRIVEVHEPGTGTLGDVVMDLQMPLHSGELGGLPGRILVALSGAAVALLAVSGVLVWWRKRRARRVSADRRRRGRAAAAGR